MASKKTAAVAGAVTIPLLLGIGAAPVLAEETPAPTAPIGETTAKVTAAGTVKKVHKKTAPSRSKAPHKYGSVSYNKWYAKNYMDYKYSWGKGHYKSLVKLWNHESGWNQRAHNGSSGAHGIPQALPGSKMASHGKNWKANPETQIKWGLSYIKGRYGTPNGAWKAFQHKGWY
jgi:Transglycosylase SLT domain